MKITNLEWNTRNDGETWTLSGFVAGSDNKFVLRKMFDVMYLGLARRANWADRKQRWKVQDRRYWINNPEDIPEFAHVHEAKAWVETIITLEN